MWSWRKTYAKRTVPFTHNRIAELRLGQMAWGRIFRQFFCILSQENSNGDVDGPPPCSESVQSCAEFLKREEARTIEVRTEKLDGLQKYEWDYVRVRN